MLNTVSESSIISFKDSLKENKIIFEGENIFILNSSFWYVEYMLINFLTCKIRKEVYI